MTMNPDPCTIRFAVGKTYRLHTSPDFPKYRHGTIIVRAELAPRDQWGNRILLVDAYLAPKGGDGGMETRLGARCFVEEGYAELRDSYGSRTIPVEIATLQGVYPDFAKAYANNEAKKGGFIPMTVTRTVA